MIKFKELFAKKLSIHLPNSEKGIKFLLKLWMLLTPFALMLAVVVFLTSGLSSVALIWFPSLACLLAISSFLGLKSINQGNITRAKYFSRMPLFHPLLYGLFLTLFLGVIGIIGEITGGY